MHEPFGSPGPFLLNAILQDPSRAAKVTREEAIALLPLLAALQVTLLTAACTPAAPTQRDPDRASDDRMLDAGEAAAMLGVSARWLYRHAKQLPFTRSIAPKIVRFSRAGIVRWLATRRT